MTAIIHNIQSNINQPGVRTLVKNWLEEQKNRAKLIQKLPHTLFMECVQSITPMLVKLFAEWMPTINDDSLTPPLDAIHKEIILAYCAFKPSTMQTLKALKIMLNQPILERAKWLNTQKEATQPPVSLTQQPQSQIREASQTATDIPQKKADATPTNSIFLPAIKISTWEDRFVHNLNQAQVSPKIGEHKIAQIIQIDDIILRKEKLQTLLLVLQQSALQQTEKWLTALPTIDIATLADSLTNSPIRSQAQISHSIKELWLPPVEIGKTHYSSYVTHYKQAFNQLLLSRMMTHKIGQIIQIDNIITRKEKLKALLSILQHSALQQTEKWLIQEDNKQMIIRERSNTAVSQKHHADKTKNRLETENLFSLEHVVHFLLHNELPNGQSIPAYFINKSLSIATSTQITHQLGVVCQETAILNKLMQYATTITVDKLFQAFIPFFTTYVYKLESIINQAKIVSHHKGKQITPPLVKKVLLTAAIAHQIPSTIEQYIERILFYLGSYSQLHPATLCDPFAYAAKQRQYGDLVEIFTMLKQHLTSLPLGKIEAIELLLLPVHESLDAHLLGAYYNHLLPVIKQINQNKEKKREVMIDHPEKWRQLIDQHLPLLPKERKTHIHNILTQQLLHTPQNKNATLIQRWHLFLHTGKLEQYTHATTLLQEVIEQLPTFSLASVLHHAAIRKRLIHHFTHTQLLLLVQKLSPNGSTLYAYLVGSYELWSLAQGALGQPNPIKHLFWDTVLETLAQLPVPFHKERWFSTTITKFSNALSITPLTLLQTFKSVVPDVKASQALEQVIVVLDKLLAQQLQLLQQKAKQNSSVKAKQNSSVTTVLEKLYVSLHGGLALLSQQYSMNVAHLEEALMQCIQQQPATFITMLKQQENKNLTARRLVYYFSPAFLIKVITLLAQNNHRFIQTYLQLFNHTLLVKHLPHAVTCQRELLTATVAYLLTVDQIDKKQLLTTTLLTIRYDPAVVRALIASVVTIQTTDPEVTKVLSLLRVIQKLMRNSNRLNPITENIQHDHPLVLLQPRGNRANMNRKEKEVRIYTKNSGLILIWPFFYDLFTTYHLMVGKQFVSVQAAHNAVYLLQHLVTGTLKSPEWQLTLPKLLCGLAYDEVLLPYTPIETTDAIEDTIAIVNIELETEDEIILETKENNALSTPITGSTMETLEANTQHILKKVLKRWKNLTNFQIADRSGITPDSFRHYFLHRLGILFKLQQESPEEKSHWHLTIMHQDEDDSDLLPPWSIDKITLPWMEDSLVVFWVPA